jgi:hypothetical protein
MRKQGTPYLIDENNNYRLEIYIYKDNFIIYINEVLYKKVSCVEDVISELFKMWTESDIENDDLGLKILDLQLEIEDDEIQKKDLQEEDQFAHFKNIQTDL